MLILDIKQNELSSWRFLVVNQRRVTKLRLFPPEAKRNEKAVPLCAAAAAAGGPWKTSGLISSFSPAGGECGSPVRLQIPAPATAREPLLCIQHTATRLVISRKASDAYLREEDAKSLPVLLLRLTLRPPLLREGRGSGQRRDVSCPPSSRGPCWYHQAETVSSPTQVWPWGSRNTQGPSKTGSVLPSVAAPYHRLMRQKTQVSRWMPSAHSAAPLLGPGQHPSPVHPAGFQTFIPLKPPCHLLPSPSQQMVLPPTSEGKIDAIRLVQLSCPLSLPSPSAPLTHLDPASRTKL